MASRGVVLFAAMLGGAAALATVKPDANCAIICVDSVNECGEKYGGYVIYHTHSFFRIILPPSSSRSSPTEGGPMI